MILSLLRKDMTIIFQIVSCLSYLYIKVVDKTDEVFHHMHVARAVCVEDIATDLIEAI